MNQVPEKRHFLSDCIYTMQVHCRKIYHLFVRSLETGRTARQYSEFRMVGFQKIFKLITKRKEKKMPLDKTLTASDDFGF